MNEFDRAELAIFRFKRAYTEAKKASRRHTLKKLITRGRILWLALFMGCWGLTPLAFAAADLERGYDSIGGEVFLPLLPVLIWVMAFTHRKTVD